MDTAEILKRVRRIEIETGKLVAETFAGEYLSVFKGQGIEFAEVRQYVPGDDIRSIDWNVSAKTGGTFVKKFNEERELTVLIACDVSGSQYFGSDGRFKSEAVVELAAVFAFSAINNNDKVGLLLFSSQIELYIPPKKGRRHVLRIIRELLAFTPKHLGTNIGFALDSINRLIKRKGILLFISDFLDLGYERALKLSARKFDFVPVLVKDKLEDKLPRANVFVDFEGIESGDNLFFNLSSKNATILTDTYMSTTDEAKRLFARSGIDYITVDDAQNVVEPLVKFFKQRARKLRR